MKTLLVAAASLALFGIPLVFAAAAESEAARNMKAFPPAEQGMSRYVLHLEKMEDESLYKVELMVGKTIQLDQVNRYFFGGKIEAKNIQGWGFTRYVVDELGPMAGTKIGVPPGAPRVDRFVTLGGEPYLIRYNSRLPVVVYVPEGAEVRYRIWRADEQISAMKEG